MEYLMKKIILSLALFGTMTHISAEMVAPGIEMISHQTWTTGNASGHVEDSRENLSKYTNEWVSLIFNAEYITGKKAVQCCDEVVRKL